MPPPAVDRCLRTAPLLALALHFTHGAILRDHKAIKVAHDKHIIAVAPCLIDYIPLAIAARNVRQQQRLDPDFRRKARGLSRRDVPMARTSCLPGSPHPKESIRTQGAEHHRRE